MSTQGSDAVYARLHRIAVVLGVLTFTLIVWGGHVNTTRSGMAFPDWPTSNLAPMVTYAPSEWLWQSDRFWEHGHRLLASVVGLITVILGLGVYRSVAKEHRPSKGILATLAVILGMIATAIVGMHSMPGGIMEGFMILLAGLLIGFVIRALRSRGDARLMWLAMSAFLGVCLQGAFGGYTVRNNLPDWTSTTHGMLAQMFFMMVIGLIMLTSRQWRTSSKTVISQGSALRGVVVTTWAFTLVQFFLGALTRHTDAWGVSVSWPYWDESAFFPGAHLLHYAQVVIHLLHRTFAYVVALMVLAQWVMVLRRRGDLRALVVPTSINALLVVVQILLGVMILWTARGEFATTAHVATGVSIMLLNTITMFQTVRLYTFGVGESATGGIVAGRGVQ
jgi:cytochrome c oxidase assembly protein subunit 15